MILIVASNRDVASRNIAAKIVDVYNFEECAETFRSNLTYRKILKRREIRLVTVEDELPLAQYVTDFFKPELVVFISRHDSRSGIPTLSVHAPGNLGEARFGGINRRVSVAPANAMRNALLEMFRQRDEMGLSEFDVSYEGTHHGPSLDVPTIFVEVGSSLREWRNPKAAEAVAHGAIAAAVRTSNAVAVLGIGGPHYNRKFTRLSLESEVAFGHMIPKYAIKGLDLKVLEHCVERTLEAVRYVVLDWKGIGSKERSGLIEFLKDRRLEVRRTSDLRKGL